MTMYVLLFAILVVGAARATDDAARIKSALAKTQFIIQDIFETWNVEHFPAFLHTVAMPTKSYEAMQLKYERLILESLIHYPARMNFTIAFTGSSVTAGHDSPYNMSFPEVTGKLMKPAFDAMNVNLVIRNVAMGNNPCIPYDACPATFAGPDADVIHWEQSYNCFPTDEGPRTHVVFETFVRQVVQMQQRPIVVFADSATPNWRSNKCEPKHILPPGTFPIPTAAEVAMLNSTRRDRTFLDLFSNLNGKDLMRQWGTLKQVIKMYKTAGIQLFSHTGYEKYNCNDPYIKDWGCCSASWHPSKKGHALRAAHHSFVWLKIFETALSAVSTMLASEKMDIAQYMHDIVARQGVANHHIPEKPLYESKYGDHLRCLTDYEPHYDPSASLARYLLPSDGVALSTENPSKWKTDIMESVFEPNSKIVENARRKGYKDFKWMHYGGKEDGPLSVDVVVRKRGFIHLCQPPGSWGKLPDAFTSLWTRGSVDIFLTTNVDTAAKVTFKFNANASNVKKLGITNPYVKDTQSVCAITDEEIPEGSHVLTLVPLTSAYAMLSIVLVP